MQLNAVSKRFDRRWKRFARLTNVPNMPAGCMDHALGNSQQGYSPPGRGRRVSVRPGHLTISDFGSASKCLSLSWGERVRVSTFLTENLAAPRHWRWGSFPEHLFQS